MYTLEKITKEFDDVLATRNIKRVAPINLNPRLRTTLGRVCWINNYYGGKSPQKVEFSTDFVESATDESIHQTILHEAAHYIVDIEHPSEHHGHDKVFRQTCEEIGCSSDRATTDVEYRKDYIPSKTNPYKYAVYCEHCGKIIGKYKTKCKTIKNIDEYYCRTCGNYELKVEVL